MSSTTDNHISIAEKAIELSQSDDPSDQALGRMLRDIGPVWLDVYLREAERMGPLELTGAYIRLLGLFLATHAQAIGEPREPGMISQKRVATLVVGANVSAMQGFDGVKSVTGMGQMLIDAQRSYTEYMKKKDLANG